MRFHNVVVLAAVTLFASAIDALAASNHHAAFRLVSSDFHTSLDVDHITTTTKRFLRTTKEDDGEDEERAFSGLTKFAQVISGAKDNYKIQSWLRNQKSLDDVFTKLQLNQAGDNLFNSPKFKTWTKYMQDYSKKNGLEDASGFSTISKYFKDEKQLSAMIEAARKEPSTARIGYDLRVQQLKDWMGKKKNPRDVYALLNVEGTAADDLNRMLWKDYLRKYRRTYIEYRA